MFIAVIIRIKVILNYFNWSIVALQCFVIFCSTANIFPFFFGFSSNLGQYKALRRVPCAIQYVPIGYFILYIVSIEYIYMYVCMSISVSQFISPLLFPLGICIFLFCVCVSIMALQIRSSIPFFLDSTYMC